MRLKALLLFCIVSTAFSQKIYQAERTKNFDLIHTKLELKPDWSTQTLIGKASISLKPHFYDQNELVLNAKSFTFSQINIANAPVKYDYDGEELRIKLPKTYRKTDTLNIEISYVAHPNEVKTKGSAAITSDKGLYFIVGENKPRQIWTQGETQANSCWFPTIDSPNAKHTQEVLLTVDKQYVTLSNGLLIKSTEHADGTRTDHWKQSLPFAPYLSMIAVGDFAIIREKVKGKEYAYYVERDFAPYALKIFGRTPEMMALFEEKLGVPFAWEKYSQIAVRDFVSGAMENVTATVHGDFVQKDPHELVDEDDDRTIAHELFHHWFGDLVTCESWSNLPLNESFANYSEYLWFEHKLGREDADLHHHAEKEGYLGEANTKREPLIRYQYADKEDMFDAHSYNKGGCVLHMLRNYVGDEAFFKALNQYLTVHKFKTAEISDLRKAFENITGEDLNWFFNQWFLSPGHAELEVYDVAKTDKAFSFKIKQLQDSASNFQTYRIPIRLDLYGQNESLKTDLWLTEKDQTFEVPFTDQLKTWVLDPEKQILGTVVQTRTKEEWKNAYLTSLPVLSRLMAVDSVLAHGAKPDDKNDLAFFETALSDKNWKVRLSALKFFENFAHDEKLNEITQKISKIVQTDAKPIVRAEAINTLQTFITNTSFTGLFENALKDTSYVVQAAAIKNLLAGGYAETDQLVNRYLPHKSGEIQKVLAEQLSKNNDPAYFSWFADHLKIQKPGVQYDFVQLFAKYSLGIDDKELQERAFKIFEDMARHHPQNFVRFGAFQSALPFMDSRERALIIVDIMNNETDPLVKGVYDQFRQQMDEEKKK